MNKRKAIIISGASQGLGFEISKKLLINNYNISICSKNKGRLIKAYKDLKKFKKKDQIIIYKAIDISKENEVKNFIKFSIKKIKKIYGIVNNAGILGPKGKFEKVSMKDWRETIDINLYGSIYMCKYILPHMIKNKEGKIIQLSGAGALAPMTNFTAYSASKAAVVRFADTLAVELKNSNIQINSLAAGAINTQMVNEIIKAGPKKVGNDFYRRMKLQKKNGGIPFDDVTNLILYLILYLLSNKSNFINGKILSPRWDDWKKWKKNKKKISNSDVFSLRRIRGKDRKFSIGDN